MAQNDRPTMYEACLYHSRADRALRLVVGRCIDKYKVTMMEWLLLGVVGDGPATGLNMSGLARLLDVTMPQVTALSSHLLQQKLIRQKASRQDRRNHYVVITGKGKSLLEDIEEDVEVGMKRWLAPIATKQLATYMETIKEISQLEQQPPPETELLEPPKPTGTKTKVTIVDATPEEL